MVGILTEMSAEFGKINYIVIGTGINTNVPKSMIPDELKELAISVADVAREPIQRVQILADYLRNMEDLYETVDCKKRGWNDGESYSRRCFHPACCG